MAEASEPPKVKLICGMLSADAGFFDTAQGRLAKNFGPVDVVSEVMPFDFTHYYDEEMGAPLHRKFVAFRDDFPPDRLVDAKLATNELERELAAGAARQQAGRGPRRVNLDPGYVAPSRLVLASMKNFSHRIYLGRGVYAEVTLMYRNRRWEPLPWTFPDYASGRYDAFLSAARAALRGRSDKESRR